jgi:hypothetical protein
MGVQGCMRLVDLVWEVVVVMVWVVLLGIAGWLKLIWEAWVA